MKQKDISLLEGLNYFITYCKVKNLSSTTIKSYEECFRYFMEFIKREVKAEIQAKEIQKNLLDNYILSMKENRLKDSTINIRIRSIRCVLYYLMEERYIDNFKINQITEDKKVKKLYTDEEVQVLLKKPNTKTCRYTEF